MKTALLLIDIQNDYFAGGKSELFEPEKALAQAEKVLKIFREAGLPVIHVQHINNREGATFFLPDTKGVEIHESLTPKQDEFMIIKHYPNSFFETDLLNVLHDQNIKSLVVCGMMSHMCIDTTVRSAKDYRLAVTLLEDACATKSLVFNGETIPAATVHKSYMAGLNNMFARVIRTSELELN